MDTIGELNLYFLGVGFSQRGKKGGGETVDIFYTRAHFVFISANMTFSLLRANNRSKGKGLLRI